MAFLLLQMRTYCVDIGILPICPSFIVQEILSVQDKNLNRCDFELITKDSYLLNKINSWLQIEAKVDKLPFDAFALVLLLLKDEHLKGKIKSLVSLCRLFSLNYYYRVVEQLLQFLVSIIDAQLLKAVELEDFETGDIQDTNEAGTLTLGAVKRSIDAGHNPLEKPFESGFGKGFDGKFHLLLGLSFGDKVSANLDARSQEAFGHLIDVDAEQVSNLLGHCVVR